MINDVQAKTLYGYMSKTKLISLYNNEFDD